MLFSMSMFAIGSYVQVAHLDQRELNGRVGQVVDYRKDKIRVRFKEAIVSVSSGILISQSQLKTKIRFNIGFVLLVLAETRPRTLHTESSFFIRRETFMF